MYISMYITGVFWWNYFLLKVNTKEIYLLSFNYYVYHNFPLKFWNLANLSDLIEFVEKFLQVRNMVWHSHWGLIAQQLGFLKGRQGFQLTVNNTQMPKANQFSSKWNKYFISSKLLSAMIGFLLLSAYI